MGAYRLLCRLGEGGMGRVFLARSSGGRAVALKTVHAGMSDTPGFRARFAREVRACQAVSGPGTAPVVAADPHAAVPWLATAYVPGPSLSEAVHEYGPLEEPALWRLLGGLGEALTTVHEAGLVHRDLKPSNVLLALDGPRLIDFGIARAADDAALTGTGLVVGSPGFMSPEQITGQEVDERGDIFALGVLLAYAGTGRGPFGSGSGPELGYRVVHHEPDLSRLPEDFAVAIRGCLAKDPAQRPSLADLVAQARERACADGDWLPAPLTSAIARRAAWALDLESRQEFGPPPVPFGTPPTLIGPPPLPGGPSSTPSGPRAPFPPHVPAGPVPSPTPTQSGPAPVPWRPPGRARLVGAAWATRGLLGRPLLGLFALIPLLVAAGGRETIEAQLHRPDAQLTPASPGWESYQWALDTTWHFALIGPLLVSAVVLSVLRRGLPYRSATAVRGWAVASLVHWLVLAVTVLVSAHWLRSALWAVDPGRTSPELGLALGVGLLPMVVLVPGALVVLVLAAVRAFRVRSRIPIPPAAPVYTTVL
ncbi:serine/threonine-protein kinase [Streptomyces sp. FIT100]|uniref:serine/threonine-protein kinase n=1 Tax=Streptomyces sp. FIT100 TaxID=2837956 RepID=UPI0021C82B20|nr:serine/threonine-protein kinase [Streptomyces sp. FIT100]UUN27354.1 serine/threonine protein kinase [Streptomyces sp. FIT100]